MKEEMILAGVQHVGVDKLEKRKCKREGGLHPGKSIKNASRVTVHDDSTGKECDSVIEVRDYGIVSIDDSNFEIYDVTNYPDSDILNENPVIEGFVISTLSDFLVSLEDKELELMYAGANWHKK